MAADAVSAAPVAPVIDWFREATFAFSLDARHSAPCLIVDAAWRSSLQVIWTSVGSPHGYCDPPGSAWISILPEASEIYAMGEAGFSDGRSRVTLVDVPLVIKVFA